MSKRTLNWRLLKKWVDDNGERSKIDLHLKSRISLHWIDKVVRGKYPSIPRPTTRNAVCVVTGIPEDKLFPTIGVAGNKAS